MGDFWGPRFCPRSFSTTIASVSRFDRTPRAFVLYVSHPTRGVARAAGGMMYWVDHYRHTNNEIAMIWRARIDNHDGGPEVARMSEVPTAAVGFFIP